MVLLYVLFAAYILAINFYAWILIKSQREAARAETCSAAEPVAEPHAASKLTTPLHTSPEPSLDTETESSPEGHSATIDKSTEQTEPVEKMQATDAPSADLSPNTEKKAKRKRTAKLCLTGALGGAITVYACMLLYKYRRTDLLLMVLMPLLGVLNVYLWVLLLKSGFTLWIFR